MARKTSANTIKVKNAYGDAGTNASNLIHNKIDYNPKVSVIIPVYNVEKYLRECLDSVLNQSLKEIEIICVDDGSTDSSLEILKEYAKIDNRITIITQENLHAGVARNAGLSVARGEYVSFLDSDDFFESNMLKEMYEKSEKLGLDICVCGADIYNNVNKTFEAASFILNMALVPKDKTVFNKYDFSENTCMFTNVAVWNKIYKRKFLIENNLYFQNLYTCNDMGMSLSALSLADKISVIDKVFVHYRYGTETQITKRRGKTAIGIIHAYCYIKKHLIDNDMYWFMSKLNSLIINNIKWELSCCNRSEKKQFRNQAKQILGEDFTMFKRYLKKENKENAVAHFVRHLKDLVCGKMKNILEYPIRVHEKYHNLKDKIRQIKTDK